jgi:hypothetical protein
MTKKWIAYPSILALALGGSLAATPHLTHAASPSPDSGWCTDAQEDAGITLLDPTQIQVKGGTSYALPAASSVSPSSAGAVSDYGYATFINNLAPIFQPGVSNYSRNALFTFASTGSAVDNSVSPAPFYPTSVETSTLTFYLVTDQAGSFATPSSFSTGEPVMTASFSRTNVGTVPNSLFLLRAPGGGTQQNLTTYGQSGVGQDFFSSGTATISSSTPFPFNGVCYAFAAPNFGSPAVITFTFNAGGHLASPTSQVGSFTGVFANAGLPTPAK